eukprot:3606850-Prorocentrum_lima.AAC.1
MLRMLVPYRRSRNSVASWLGARKKLKDARNKLARGGRRTEQTARSPRARDRRGLTVERTSSVLSHWPFSCGVWSPSS